MLRICTQKDPRRCDLLITPSFFLRHVPQAFTKFLPFKLVYRHKPRGLLTLLKGGWEQPTLCLLGAKAHCNELRAHFLATRQVTLKNLREAQRKQKRSYDRMTKDRKFPVRGRVLVLLPTMASKLLTK